MLKLKTNAGIPAVNFLMVAAAVLGASYLAVKSFDTDLTTNLGTMTSSHLTSLAAVDTANAPIEPGAGAGEGAGAGAGAGGGAASSAVTNLSANGFCRLSIVVPDDTDNQGFVFEELDVIEECKSSSNVNYDSILWSNGSAECVSLEKNYIQFDTSQVNKERPLYSYDLRYNLSPDTNIGNLINYTVFYNVDTEGYPQNQYVQQYGFYDSILIQTLPVAGGTNFECVSWDSL